MNKLQYHGEPVMDFLNVQQDYRIYRVGLYETYLFKPHVYMPLVCYSNGRIDNLTMENLR